MKTKEVRFDGDLFLVVPDDPSFEWPADSTLEFGQYADIQSDTAFAVGNGTSHTARSNLFEIKTNGDVYVNGVRKL